MAEDFNDLIDQTETRAQALNAEADKALELLDSVDEMLDNLSSSIEESAEEAKSSFDTLTEQITTAEDTLQTQQEEARESMNGLMQQMQEAGGKIQESLTNAFNKFEELQAKQQEFWGEIGGELENIKSSFEELGNECNQTVEKNQDQFAPFSEIVDRFIEVISSELEEIDTNKTSLKNQLSSLIEVAGDTDSALYEEFKKLLEVTNENIKGSAQLVRVIFEKSVLPEKEKFIDSTKSLNSIINLLEHKIIDVGKESQQSENEVHEGFDRATKKVVDIFKLINETDQILDSSRQILN